MADTGKSAAEIARVLKISVGTVNVHLRSSKVKLGVKKTSEAVYISSKAKRILVVTFSAKQYLHPLKSLTISLVCLA